MKFHAQSDSDREMLILAELVLVDKCAQVPASQPHLELLVPHVVKGGDGEHLPYAAAFKLLRNDSGEEVQDQVGFPLVFEHCFRVAVEREDEAGCLLAVSDGLQLAAARHGRRRPLQSGVNLEQGSGRTPDCHTHGASLCSSFEFSGTKLKVQF